MLDPRGAFRGVLLAVVAAKLLAGCDAPPSGGGTASPALPAPSLAPSVATSTAPTPSGAFSGPVVPAIPCRTATDCGPNGWCQFDKPGCGPAIRGTCAGPQASCTVYYPFCSCTGETVGACEKPLVAYAHPGPCADAGAARPPK
jgi:hypothetical protein